MKSPVGWQLSRKRSLFGEDDVLRRVSYLEGAIPAVVGPSQSPQKVLSHPHFREAGLHLRPGTWHVNQGGFSTSNTYEHVVGSGYHTNIASNGGASSLWSITHDGALLENIRFTSATLAVTIVGADDVTIRNCWFEGTDMLYHILATNADRLRIEGCLFEGGSDSGVKLTDSDDAIIVNNRILDVNRSASAYAINLNSTVDGAADTRCNDCIVVGNHVTSSGSIRYNTTGSHAVTGNNTGATLDTY
jgi:hypothetical protein